jgi:hypothetical protein
VHEWNLLDDGLLRLLVVDFGKLYQGDFAAAYIPDPWLLCFKSASNWSAFAYRDTSLEDDDVLLKLLPDACSLEDESSTISAKEIENDLGLFQLLQDKMDRAKIKGLSSDFTTNDNESVSSIGA